MVCNDCLMCLLFVSLKIWRCSWVLLDNSSSKSWTSSAIVLFVAAIHVDVCDEKQHWWYILIKCCCIEIWAMSEMDSTMLDFSIFGKWKNITGCGFVVIWNFKIMLSLDEDGLRWIQTGNANSFSFHPLFLVGWFGFWSMWKQEMNVQEHEQYWNFSSYRELYTTVQP